MEGDNNLNNQDYTIFNNIQPHYQQITKEPFIKSEGLKGKELILFEVPKNVKLS
jgi:hypothetical protein